MDDGRIDRGWIYSKNGGVDMRAPFAAAVAISVGLVILMGYFVSLPVLQNLRILLIGWAVILAGIATLVGIINLVRVHVRRIAPQNERDWYSLILVVAFLITAVIGLVLGPGHPQFQHVVTSIQVPIEASLMAMLAITLAYASLRLLQRRKGFFAFVFVFSAIVFLLLGSGLLRTSADIPILKDLLSALNQLPIAGARGILLGIGLGSLTTGLRILLGADRPYSG